MGESNKDPANKNHVCWYRGMAGLHDEDDESVGHMFASGTSCHGLPRVAESCHTKRKAMWTIIVTGAFAMILWQVSLRVQAYLTWPSNTVISHKYKNDMPFPAVTICNFNKYMNSKLNDCDRPVVEATRELAREHPSKKKIRSVEENLQWCYGGHYDHAEFSKEKGWPLDANTMLSCRFRNEPCNETMWSQTFTPHGNCYTFNANRDVIQNLPGAPNGLHMELDVVKNEYTQSIEDHLMPGLKFVVHPQGEPPFVTEDGYALSPGFEVSAAIRQRHYINLNKPWGDCNSSLSTKHFSKYSMSSCITECQLSKVEEACGCRPIHFPGDLKLCSLSELVCAKKTINEVNHDLRTHCKCPVPCDYQEYDVRLSYGRFPSHHHAERLAKQTELTAEYIKNNVAAMKIYFESLRYEEIEQQEAITFTELLSDIGGQMGLFLGMSIMTTLECLEFIITFLIRSMTSSPNGKKKKKQ